jgi:hypothetical protein
MAEPSAIWSAKLIIFDKSISLTQNVILSHARVALHALVDRIDRLHQQVRDSPPIVDFYAHPDIPSTLSDLGFQQGVASTILFNDGPKSARENSASYQLRLDRLAYVKRHCANISTTVLENRKIRNSLVHVDEYLARELAKAPNTGWMIDSAIGRRDQFTAPPGISIGFCRMYIASEDVLLHLGNEISIAALRAEAKGVLSAIWGEP